LGKVVFGESDEMNLVQSLERQMAKPNANVPELRAGDIVKVYVRIVEGDRERVQPSKGRLSAAARVAPMPISPYAGWPHMASVWNARSSSTRRASKRSKSYVIPRFAARNFTSCAIVVAGQLV
jgi:hypothetical protein